MHAAKVLDEYHYGLGRAKDRILEYIAVRIPETQGVRASRSYALSDRPERARPL
jgi:ATP-dependent Lon protease